MQPYGRFRSKDQKMVYTLVLLNPLDIRSDSHSGSELSCLWARIDTNRFFLLILTKEKIFQFHRASLLFILIIIPLWNNCNGLFQIRGEIPV